MLRGVLPSGRMSTTEDPRIHSESFNPCNNVGNLLNPLLGGRDKKLAIKIRLRLCLLGFEIFRQ